LFLLRRTKDPGFFHFILAKIAGDNSYLKKTRKYIKKVFLENFDRIDQTLFKLPDKEENNAISDIEIKPTVTYSSDHPLITKIKAIQINKDALNFFQMKLKQAIEKEDYNEINAIQFLIYEYTFGKYFGYWLFSSSSPYTGTSQVEHWKYLGRKFVIENIRFEAFYYLTPQITERLFYSYIPYNTVYEFIHEKIMDEIWDEYKGTGKRNAAVENKFYNDIVSIASILWFQDKSQEKKIEILNKYYPLSISDEFLENLTMKSGLVY